VRAVVRPRVVVAAIVLSLLAARAAQEVKWAGTTPGNFEAFYLAGRLAAKGQGTELYSIPVEYGTLKQLGFGPGDYHLWTHPAFEALLLEWVEPLSYRRAARTWAVLMVLVLAMGLWLLRDTGSLGLVVMGVLLGGLYGVLNQDIALLLLVLVASFLALRRGRDGAGGALLACGLFRFHLIWLFVAVLLLKRRWKALGGFSAVGALLGAISLWLAGPGMLRAYSTTLRVTALEDAGFLWMMPTARGFGSLVLPHSEWILILLSCLVAGPVMVAWMRQPWDGSARWEMMFSVTVVAGLAIAYHSFLYDAVVLLLPISVLAKRARSPVACGLFGSIPFAAWLACGAAVFPILAAEVALMLNLWRRSGGASPTPLPQPTETAPQRAGSG
jgi:Glycosyltransferase family 87